MAQRTHAGAVHARNLRYGYSLMPTVRDEGMQHREEAGQEDRDAAAALEIVLGANPVVLTDSAPQPRHPDVRAQPAPQPEADALADQCPDHDRDAHRDALQWSGDPIEAMITIVSPGTTRPIRMLVSSITASPAISVRATGSIDCTVSRSQIRRSSTP